MTFTLPKLAYNFSDLEPWIDAATVEIHYSKHHQKYCDNFNAVISKYPTLSDWPAEEILKKINEIEVSEEDRTQIKNHGGGFANHNLYWLNLGPKKILDAALLEEINKNFGSPEKMREEFNKKATALFGSGWTWLVRDETGKLRIYNLPNQDSPLSIGHTPILALDLWEHAYYLKYQNRRPEYIENWWKANRLVS